MHDQHEPTALLPLRGLRFRPDVPGGLSSTIGPPADLESSENARAFVRDRPYSAVRLELSDEGDEDGFGGARRLLSEWKRTRVLDRDPHFSYYVYQQEFDDAGIRRTRRGIFGLVPVNGADVVVLPHEDTWEDNLSRRLSVLRDLDASLSPILLLYDGGSTGMSRLLDELTTRPPDTAGRDETGEDHRLWIISAPEQVAEVARAMRGRGYLIADGHHRFEAARIYHQEQDRPSTGFILACCVDVRDPGVVIRPIHRLLALPGARNWDQVLADLAKWFRVETLRMDDRDGWSLVAELPGEDQPAAGLILPDERFVILTLRDRDIASEMLPEEIPPAVSALDVTVVSELVIHTTFGVDPSDPADEITYTNNPSDALAAIRRGDADVAVLLRPPALRQVLAVATAHGRMPPKSTSFVPKVPIGLVMHEFEDDRDG